jgi:FSR family fosmidomycin resistance protein-like MFS transporter
MTDSTIEDPQATRSDVKVLTLISAGHFLSHYFMLALPALFIFFNKDLGISYTLLGVMLTTRYVGTGVAQIAAGFMVDRFGAKMILMAGIILMVTAMGLMAFASNYYVLMLLVILAGVGDAVFHPADYAILSSSISEKRMGRSFSVHTFAGHLGFAAAPAVIVFVSTVWDWRTALLISAGVGFAIIFVMLTQWSSLNDSATKAKKKDTSENSEEDATTKQLLTSRPVLLLFAFFVMTSLAGSGLHSFSIPALHALHGTSVVDAGFAVGGYMLISSFAVLCGGWIADNITRQDRFAAMAYAASIFVVGMIVWMPMHYALLVFLFGLAGFCHGVVRPARDMMVREVAPKGSTGRVFGFIFTGQNVGGGLAPILLGGLMDHYPPQYIFYFCIGFMILCILTILAPRGPMKKTSVAPTGAGE